MKNNPYSDISKAKRAISKAIRLLQGIDWASDIVQDLITAHSSLDRTLTQVRRQDKNYRPLKRLKTPRGRISGGDLYKLWAADVKAHAGYKSEFSGKTGVLCAHHIHRKQNLWLRYDLRNGICLTMGEHKYGAHGPDGERYRRIYSALPGKMSVDEGDIMRHKSGKPDLNVVRIRLQAELKRCGG